MMDAEMISRAPEGVTVERFQEVPDSVRDFDAVVLTGACRLPGGQLASLAGVRYTFWPHDCEETIPDTYALAERVIFSSGLHRAWATATIGPYFRGTELIPWMDTGFVDQLGYRPCYDTLWAHRNVWHKGLDLAQSWADGNDARLTVVTDRPRDEVLRAMADHRRFILLSHIPDTCPRSVTEAQLLYCDIVVNDNVGYWDLPPDELRTKINSSDKAFWELVLE